MFTTPRLEHGQKFPELPTDHPDWQELLDTVEVPITPGQDNPLLTLTRHAIGWVEGDPAYVRPWHHEPVETSSRTPVLRRAGFIDPILPAAREQDVAVMDGGHLHNYRRRLGHFTAMERRQLIETPQLIVFAGQRLRSDEVDDYGKLATIAHSLEGRVDKATGTWLACELAKDPMHPNVWHRPFATERELGRLGLALQYGPALQHQGTIARPDPRELHPSIPVPVDAADEFSVHGQRVVLLNAAAKIREHAGRKKDISQARPTGRSCFYEWMQLDQPAPGSSVMLVTSAPNTYRSWFDMVLRAAEAERDDLCITATGAAISEGRTMSHVLVGLGDLLINFYSLKYENGVDSPDEVQPFQI